MKNKYIYFNKLNVITKTFKFEITSITTDLILGIIKWYPQWRQYCFYPAESTIFNADCMKIIQDFIIKLMDDRK